MNKFKRFLAYAAIGSAILGIIMAFVSVIGIWRIYSPLTTGLDRLLSATERGLEIVDQGLATVDPVIGILANAMVEIQENGDQLAADIEASDPIVDTLSLLLDKDISPKVNEVLSTLGTIQQTAEEVNAAVQTFSALPFIDIGGLTQVTQQFVDLMNDVKDGVKQIDQLVDELKQGISQEVIGPIQERAALMETELTNLQDEIQKTNAEVKTIHQAVITIRPMLPTIIGAISVLLTIQLLWGAVAQVALIYLVWMYLKFGRLDLHKMVESTPETT